MPSEAGGNRQLHTLKAEKAAHPVKTGWAFFVVISISRVWLTAAFPGPPPGYAEQG